jgi:hypothetical protein
MVNYQDVITKFKEISRLYGHPKGNMIFTIDNNDFDIRSIPLQWDIVYLSVARANLYRAFLEVIVFSKKLLIPIYKPIEPVEVLEFEDFFNFGSHCIGYDPNRLVAVLPTDINTDFNIDEILQTDNINYEYVNENIKLLCLGGFIKYWKGFTAFCEWFKNEADIELNISNTFKLLFNNITPVIKLE